VVIFQPLTEDELAQIAGRMAFGIAARTKVDRNISIVVQPNLLRQMVKEGSKAANQFGARPMRRAVQRILEDAISTAVMKNFVSSGDTAVFDLESDVPEECDVDASVTYTVAVSRSRDKEVLRVDMEESCRDTISEPLLIFEEDGSKDNDVHNHPNGARPVPAID
jgi:hypothetical protein